MWKCDNCNTELEDAIDPCWKCGTGKDGTPAQDPAVFDRNRQDALELEVDPGDGAQLLVRPRNFYDLVADGLFVVAGIIVIATIVMAIVAAARNHMSEYLLSGLLTLISGIPIVLLIVAIAALLRLALDIEWNTRRRD